jgi:hypothetical protein
MHQTFQLLDRRCQRLYQHRSQLPTQLHFQPLDHLYNQPQVLHYSRQVFQQVCLRLGQHQDHLRNLRRFQRINHRFNLLVLQQIHQQWLRPVHRLLLCQLSFQQPVRQLVSPQLHQPYNLHRFQHYSQHHYRQQSLQDQLAFLQTYHQYSRVLRPHSLLNCQRYHPLVFRHYSPLNFRHINQLQAQQSILQDSRLLYPPNFQQIAHL